MDLLNLTGSLSVGGWRWLLETGNVEAQYSAGVLYETVDVEKSRYWLQRAASSGDLDAKTKLAQLNTQ